MFATTPARIATDPLEGRYTHWPTHAYGPCGQSSRVYNCVITRALVPINPESRRVGTTGARVSFRHRNIFPHFCMLFLKLPLCRYAAYIQLKRHTQLVLQVEYMLSSFFTNKIHIATENFNKQKTHRPMLPIRLAHVISKMANFYVCCDKQQ